MTTLRALTLTQWHRHVRCLFFFISVSLLSKQKPLKYRTSYCDPHRKYEESEAAHTNTRKKNRNSITKDLGFESFENLTHPQIRQIQMHASRATPQWQVSRLKFSVCVLGCFFFTLCQWIFTGCWYCWCWCYFGKRAFRSVILHSTKHNRAFTWTIHTHTRTRSRSLDNVSKQTQIQINNFRVDILRRTCLKICLFCKPIP